MAIFYTASDATLFTAAWCDGISWRCQSCEHCDIARRQQHQEVVAQLTRQSLPLLALRILLILSVTEPALSTLSLW